MASTIKVDNVQNTPGTNIVSKCGTDVTLGASGDTVALASGASQTGFGRTGTVDWQTSDIKTTGFTAATGKGYFVNTTSGGVTVTLPAGSAGDIVGLKDYAGTWGSNAITLAPNGSDNIGGATATDPTVENEGGSLLLVYVDATQGWLTTQQSVTPSPSGAEILMVASGGNSCCTSGDYKYHVFTGPGTFTVCSIAGCASQNVVSYVVVAGGGGAGGDGGGGGGAGGFREYKNSCDPYTASPLNGNPGGTAVTVTATAYPITIGGGGAGNPTSSPTTGTSGSDSIFSTITSSGGGAGAYTSALAGGSGGGGGRGGTQAGGAGDTPSTTPAQGFAGGDGQPSGGGGGGGGATVIGASAPSNAGANGGDGATSSIDATPTARAGGGGGGATPSPNTKGSGGSGGGGDGVGGTGSDPTVTLSTVGTINTGGGGGGGTGGPSAGNPANHYGLAGGSGIVIIRYKFQ